MYTGLVVVRSIGLPLSSTVGAARRRLVCAATLFWWIRWRIVARPAPRPLPKRSLALGAGGGEGIGEGQIEALDSRMGV